MPEDYPGHRRARETFDAYTSSQGLNMVERPVWDEIDTVALTAPRLTTKDEYEAVASVWKRLKARIAEIREFFAPRKRQAKAAYDQWLKDEHETIDRYVDAERRAALLLGDYDAAQREAAAAEARRLEAEDRARAEADQLAAALQADADGAQEIADEILIAPAGPVGAPRAVAAMTPSVSDMTTAGRWKAELMNLDTLILAAAAEIVGKRARVATSMLKADPVAINRAATSMKGNLASIATTLGLRVWEDRRPRMK